MLLENQFINFINLIKYKDLSVFCGIVMLVLLLSACGSGDTSRDLGTFNDTLNDTLKNESHDDLVSTVVVPNNTISNTTSSKQDDSFYHALVASMYQQQNEGLLAIQHYLLAANYSTDTSLLKKAAVLAARAGQTDKALEAALRWSKHAPESLEARQYLALLYLRSDQYKKSASTLEVIRLIVGKESTEKAVSHQFISQLLSMESHSHQAFKAYQAYLKKYGVVESNLKSSGFKSRTNTKNPSANFDLFTHQQMTLASLAMKAGEYKIVDTALATIKDEGAILTRSKALNKLGRPQEAVNLLRPIVNKLNKKKTNDSLRFEFVRFLILADQKDEATNLLKKLVKKHPANKDLLKSLVALNLAQNKWDDAERYANKLVKFEDYKSDAKHFLGEIFEARGENKKALAAYLQVVDGNMKNSAEARIPALLEKNKGLAAARLWLHRQRATLRETGASIGNKIERRERPDKNFIKTDSGTVKKKASLYKIEADLLFSEDSFDAAMEFYQRALVLDPENNDIRYSRALVYEQQGQIDLAERDFLHILKINSNDTSALNALGYMLAVHTERLDEAHSLIKKAYLIDPNDAAITDSLGWLYYKRGEVETAEHYIRKAFKEMKEPEIASHLIEVLQKQGLKQEARVILFQMLQLFPENKKLKQAKQGLVDI